MRVERKRMSRWADDGSLKMAASSKLPHITVDAASCLLPTMSLPFDRGIQTGQAELNGDGCCRTPARLHNVFASRSINEEVDEALEPWDLDQVELALRCSPKVQPRKCIRIQFDIDDPTRCHHDK